MRRYPLYIEGNPISYEVKIELPAFMNKEWVDKLGDIQVIIPLAGPNDVKIKKHKSGIQILDRFISERRYDKKINSNEFRNYMGRRGYQNCMKDVPFT